MSNHALIPQNVAPLFAEGQTDSLVIRERIFALEEQLLKLPQVEMPLKHNFAEGLYAREIFVPAGTLLTGYIHKFEHLNIISKGDISVLTEHGTQRIKAPHTMVSKPGTKRVGYAHEDTIWTTIHANPTGETDIDKLEDQLVTNSHDEVELTDKEISQLREVIS